MNCSYCNKEMVEAPDLGKYWYRCKCGATDNIKKLRKPKKVMTIKGPFRKIDIYDQQPIANQVKIVQVFMEAEVAKEKLRS